MAYYRGQEFNPANSKDKETKDAEIAKLREQVEGLMSGKTLDEISADRELISEPSKDVNMGWDMESARGTLWGAFNTVTYMSDHKPVRDHGQDNRLDKAFYGAGATDIKTKAFNKAKELLVA